MGEFDSAFEYLGKVRKCFEESGDEHLRGGVFFTRGYVEYERGRFEESVKSFEQLVGWAEEHDVVVADFHANLAGSYSRVGRHQLARRQSQIALEAARENGTKSDELLARMSFADTENTAGCLTDAARHLISVLMTPFHPTLGFVLGNASTIAGWIASKNGNHAEAVRWGLTYPLQLKERGYIAFRDEMKALESHARAAIGDAGVEAAIAQGQALTNRGGGEGGPCVPRRVRQGARAETAALTVLYALALNLILIIPFKTANKKRLHQSNRLAG